MDMDILKDGILCEGIKEIKDPGRTKRIQAYEENISSYSPRKQNRILFAKNFRRALRISGITQKELSKRLGVSAPLVSGWANAQSMPSAEDLEKMSEIFGTDVSAWADPQDPTGILGPGVDFPEFSADEVALVMRVRRMSEEERGALYTLLHVLR